METPTVGSGPAHGQGGLAERAAAAGAPPGVWLLFAMLALGLAIVVGTIIAARTVAYVKTFDTSQMTVTGEAVQALTSNDVEWTGSFSVNTYLAQLEQGYAQMATNSAAVIAYLRQHGVPVADITLSAVNANQNYVDCKANPKACGPFGSTSYTLTQNVTVQSTNVAGVTALAQNVGPLVKQGVVFSTQSVEYYYTKLDQLRARLEAQATANAQARAREIARATGSRVGRLISVTTEPLQLTALNSPNVSNSGAYDTSSIQKQLTAIVEASFRLK